jgi:hypothetical protein
LHPCATRPPFAESRAIPGQGRALVWPTADIQIAADTFLGVETQQAPDETTWTFVQPLARDALSLPWAGGAVGSPT